MVWRTAASFLGALLILGSVGAGSSAAADAITDPLRRPAALVNPPTDVRPYTRWWWGDALETDEIREELRAIAAAGFGGAEIAYMGAWATKGQRAAFATALRTAAELGIDLDTTMGKAWPINTPNTGGDEASPHRSQEMMYGAMSLVGPGEYRVEPPVAQDLNIHIGTSGPFQPTYGEVPARLVAVTAARVLEEGTPVVYTSPDVPYTAVSPTAPAKSTVLDPGSVVDLTDEVGADGKVTFQADQPGRWIVFSLWQRPGIQKVMDHFSEGAVVAATSYLERHQVGRENFDLLRRGSDFFEDSLELAFQGVPWTNGFLEQFEQRRGYNLAPYASTLFIQDAYNVPGHDPENMPNADFEFPDSIGERVRHDYIETLSEMFQENHLAGLHRWARSHGMNLRAQPYGSVMNGTAAARSLAAAGGGADIESLGAGDPAEPGTAAARRAFDMYRLGSSGVEQGGGNDVGSELGATFTRNYATSLSEYKALMDKEWAAGVTTPIIHGFANQEPNATWPGTDYMFGAVAQSWNHRNFPEWAMWRNLTDYWARGAWVLRSGEPRQDVVVYHDHPHAAGTDTVFDSQRLEEVGYTFGFVDDEGLSDKRASGDGVLYPNGPSYRAVVIDTEGAMSGEAAQALARYSAKGLAVVVVGNAPERGMSNSRPRAEDRKVRAAFKRILDAPRTRIVDDPAAIAPALARVGVRPAASPSEPSPLLTRQRRTAGVDYWYLWNGGKTPIEHDVSFASSGIPKSIDLWSGDVEPVAEFQRRGNRTTLPVSLQPGETRVVAFDRRAREKLHVVHTNADAVTYNGSSIEVQDWVGGRSRTVELSDGRRRVVRFGELPQPLVPATWDLHVRRSAPQADPAGQHYELTELRDWRQIPGLELASGAGTYTASVSVPRSWLSATRGVELDLGTVWGTVEVVVNGRRVTTAATPHQPYDAAWLEAPATTPRADITRWLRPGRNTIRVVLTTTLRNAVIGAIADGIINAGAAGQTQPYGLGGPVQLRPYARSWIAAPSRSGVS